MNLVFKDPATGKKYSVGQGIGSGQWGLFRERPNGALRRVKSPAVPMTPDQAEAEKNARAYALKKGWKEIRGWV